MNGRTAFASTALGAALVLSLSGCAPTVQQQAEENLNNQLAYVQKSFAGSAPQVKSTSELLNIGYIPDFSGYATDDTLSLNVTGWYQQDQRGGTGTIYVLGVGRAEGHEGLAYADAIVFRCARMTVPLGREGAVATEKVPCPTALRRAANIGRGGPEV